MSKMTGYENTNNPQGSDIGHSTDKVIHGINYGGDELPPLSTEEQEKIVNDAVRELIGFSDKALREGGIIGNLPENPFAKELEAANDAVNKKVA